MKKRTIVILLVVIATIACIATQFVGCEKESLDGVYVYSETKTIDSFDHNIVYTIKIVGTEFEYLYKYGSNPEESLVKTTFTQNGNSLILNVDAELKNIISAVTIVKSNILSTSYLLADGTSQSRAFTKVVAE